MIAGYALLALFGAAARRDADRRRSSPRSCSRSLTERAAFRPLRDADPATLLISSFAVSFFLEKTLILFVGSRPKGIDFLPALGRQVEIFGVRLQSLQIVTILVSAVLLAGADLVPEGHALRPARCAPRPRISAWRACSACAPTGSSPSPSRMSGILAAAVSCLVVAQTGIVQPRMGLQLVIIAFVGTVIGGLGSLTGAALGGFLVGVGDDPAAGAAAARPPRLPRGLRLRRGDAGAALPAAGPDPGARPEGAHLTWRARLRPSTLRRLWPLRRADRARRRDCACRVVRADRAAAARDARR